MLWLIRTSLACVALFSALTSTIFGTEPTDIDSLRHRQSITSGRVSLVIRTAVRSTGEQDLLDLSPGIFRTDEITVWFDGDKQRFDKTVEGVVAVDGNGRRLFTADDKPTSPESLIVTGEKYIFSPRTNYKGVKISSRIGVRQEMGALGKSVFDIRGLGLIPMSHDLWFRIPINRFVGFEGADRNKTIAPQEPGAPAKSVFDYKRPDGKLVRIFIANTTGDVVRVEFENLETHRIEEVESTYEEFTGGVRFPRSVTYRCRKSGTLAGLEHVEVLNAEFNSPLDPRLFTLEGLSLPEGTVIAGLSADVSTDSAGVWNRRKIEPLPLSAVKPHSTQPVEIKSTDSQAIIRMVIGVHLVAGFVFLISWMVRLRR